MSPTAQTAFQKVNKANAAIGAELLLMQQACEAGHPFSLVFPYSIRAAFDLAEEPLPGILAINEEIRLSRLMFVEPLEDDRAHKPLQGLTLSLVPLGNVAFDETEVTRGFK
jgi:hypothetical protein